MGLNRQIYRGQAIPMARIFRKIVKKIAPILSKGLTNALQGEIGAKNDLCSFWLGMRDIAFASQKLPFLRHSETEK